MQRIFLENFINENKLEEIGSVPSQTKKVLVMYYSDKLTQSNIAIKLNIPLSRVKQHLSKGKYLIKKKIGCAEYDEAFRILYPTIKK